MNKIYSWRLRHVTAVPHLLRYTVARRRQPICCLRAFAAQGLQRGLMRAKGSISALSAAQPHGPRATAWASRSRMATHRKQRPKNAQPHGHAPQATPEERVVVFLTAIPRGILRGIPKSHLRLYP